MNIKKWEISHLDKDRAAKIAEQYNIPFFLAMLLDIRGISGQEQIEELLQGRVSLSDPYLMKDMDKAVSRIRRALDDYEKIAVYGDYDADGVTSTAMLFTYLEAVGADVIYYIPQREGEGYGMNPQAVRTLHHQGVSLIITVDNGISSVEEVALAKELGIDVVVTDHHRPQDRLPQAVAVVDAYQEGDTSPYKDFSGAGVVLKLLIALEDGDALGVLGEYADLAALGTVGDVVPIYGENRAIVKLGLEMLQRGGRLGLEALMEQSGSGRGVTSITLAYTIIPRINATGRMGAPERAVRLLTCEDEDEAASLAAEICDDNQERRRVEADILQEAFAEIQSNPSLSYSRVIIVSGKNWHHGVIGIVASRVMERFGKPCMIISEDGESAKGSGRSVEGFSLFQAVSACSSLLERFGGHPMAAGVTLKAENIPAFRDMINLYAQRVCPKMPPQVIKLDCRLNPASLSVDMPRDLQRLEPFGSGNPLPLFGLYGMELKEIIPVGGGNHLRLMCTKNGATIACMRFGMKPEELPYSPGAKVDLAVTLDLKEYRGEPQLTVIVKEMKASGLDSSLCIHSYRCYEKLMRREALEEDEAELLAPTREEMAALYRLLAAYHGKSFGVQPLLCSLADKGFSLGKLLVCLDILEERGLIRCAKGEQSMSAELLPAEGKVDLFASPVFQGLRA